MHIRLKRHCIPLSVIFLACVEVIHLTCSGDLLYDMVKHVRVILGVFLLKVKMTFKIGQMSHSLHTPISLP